MPVQPFAQTARVKAIIAQCDEWYATKNYAIRAVTERIDALWLEVEYYLSLMEEADRENDREASAQYLERVIHYVTRIHGEFNSHNV